MLPTLNKPNKDKESDETSSTHQLADPENSPRDALDDDALTGHGPASIYTIISSSNQGVHIDRGQHMAGILVQNDMMVKVEERELPKAYQR